MNDFLSDNLGRIYSNLFKTASSPYWKLDYRWIYFYIPFWQLWKFWTEYTGVSPSHLFSFSSSVSCPLHNQPYLHWILQQHIIIYPCVAHNTIWCLNIICWHFVTLGDIKYLVSNCQVALISLKFKHGFYKCDYWGRIEWMKYRDSYYRNLPKGQEGWCL